MMIEQDNVAVVRAVYAAFLRTDTPSLLEYLTSDIKWFAVGQPRIIPTAGTRYGRNQVAQYFSILSATEDLQNFQAEEFIAEEDTVVTIGTLKTRLKETGKLLQTSWVHVFNFHKGKISEFRSFYDTDAVVEAHLNEQVMSTVA